MPNLTLVLIHQPAFERSVSPDHTAIEATNGKKTSALKIETAIVRYEVIINVMCTVLAVEISSS